MSGKFLFVSAAALAVGKCGVQQVKQFSEVSDEPMWRFQMLDTHNSYHSRPDPYIPESYTSWGSLNEQMDAGVRAFEFDIWRVPGQSDEFLIYHVETFDEESTVSTLKEALDELKEYMDTNPHSYRGEPAYIGLEPQESDNWSAQDFENLDALIKNELGSMVFTPAELGADATNRTKKWPSFKNVAISSLEDRILLRINARELPEMFDSEELNPAELSFFYSCKSKNKEDPYCSFFNVNDAEKKKSDVLELVAEGYLVKCNADSDYVEIPGVEFAQNGETGEWEATYEDDSGTGNYVTESTKHWAAGYLFDVINKLDDDDTVDWNETLLYVELASEMDIESIEWAIANTKPLCPISRGDYSALGDLYVELHGEVNVDLLYVQKQANSSLTSGCQIIQTEHIFQTVGVDDDYIFNLGCGSLSHVEYRYTDEDGEVWCVEFTAETTEEPQTTRDAAHFVSFVVAATVALFSTLLQ